MSKVREKPIRALFWLPNGITFMVMASGLVGMILASKGFYKETVMAIVFAGIFDGVDGFAARKTGHVSEKGAELDSLSDMVSFGVAPAIILYHWSLQTAPLLWQLPVIIYPACAGYRLARFNVMDRDPATKGTNFFTGLASPSGAVFSLMPMILSLNFGNLINLSSPYVVAMVMLTSAGLMVSPFPTPSIKQARKIFVIPLLVTIALGMVVSFWNTVALCGVLYAFSVLVGWVYHLGRRLFQRRSMQHATS